MAKKRMQRGSKIDFAQVKIMSFKTYVQIHIGSEEEVALENGNLELRHGFKEDLDGIIPMSPALEEQLTQLFEACDVSNWKRHYTPPKDLCVLDGYGWDLTLVFKDESVFETGGSNGWPDQFDNLDEGLLGLFEGR